MQRNRLVTASAVAMVLAAGGLVFALTGPGGAGRNAAIGAETSTVLSYVNGTAVTSTGTAVRATTVATATCPSTTRIAGGGARVIGNTATSGYVSASYPSKTDLGGVWTAQMTLVSYSAGSGQPRVQAYAICSTGGTSATTTSPQPSPTPTTLPVSPSTFAFTTASKDRVITEGNAGTTPVTFTVTRSGSLSQPTAVAWSVGYPPKSATALPATANDFSGTLSGTLNFAANQSTINVTVSINGDTTYEGSETFLVNVVNGTTTVSAATIIKNDDASTPVY